MYQTKYSKSISLFIRSSVCLSPASSKHPCGPCCIVSVSSSSSSPLRSLCLPLPSKQLCPLVRAQLSTDIDRRARARPGRARAGWRIWASTGAHRLTIRRCATPTPPPRLKVELGYGRFAFLRLITSVGLELSAFWLLSIDFCCVVCIYCVASTRLTSSFRLTVFSPPPPPPKTKMGSSSGDFFLASR